MEICIRHLMFSILHETLRGEKREHQKAGLIVIIKKIQSSRRLSYVTGNQI